VHMLVQQYLPKKPLPDLPKSDRLRDLRAILHKNLMDIIKYYDYAAPNDEKIEERDPLKINPFNIQHSASVAVIHNTIIPKTDDYTLCLFGNKITQ
jgi:hypothetical protein